MNQHNKVVKHIVEVISSARDDWETETASRTSLPQTCSINETHTLLAALGDQGTGVSGTEVKRILSWLLLVTREHVSLAGE